MTCNFMQTFAKEVFSIETYVWLPANQDLIQDTGT